MSEDRLEKALQEMRQEEADASTLDAARARVWDRVAGTASAGCAEFRPDLRAYLSGALGGNRRVLMEDHLGRCPACRAAIWNSSSTPGASMPRRLSWIVLVSEDAVVVVAQLDVPKGSIPAGGIP